MIRAIDAMQSGELDRAYVFGVPGHHAHRDWGHGYCLLNPLAAAAVYAIVMTRSRVRIQVAPHIGFLFSLSRSTIRSSRFFLVSSRLASR